MRIVIFRHLGGACAAKRAHCEHGRNRAQPGRSRLAQVTWRLIDGFRTLREFDPLDDGTGRALKGSSH
jgi:hypothetical protein